MSSLYHLTGELQYLLDMSTDPTVPEDVLKDTIEGVTGEIEVKAEGYAKVIAELKARKEALDKEADRMKSESKVIENSITRMKEALFQAMKVANKPKFKTELFSFTIKKNAPALDIPDEKLVSPEYLIEQAPKIDKERIKKDIKEGKEITWASLKQSESLIIR